MRVKWLARALQNLDNEAQYIAQSNPQAASHTVQRIIRAIDLLKDNPAMGRPGRVDGSRELTITGTPYIVPYRVKSELNQLEILRVFHASRRLPDNW